MVWQCACMVAQLFSKVWCKLYWCMPSSAHCSPFEVVGLDTQLDTPTSAILTNIHMYLRAIILHGFGWHASPADMCTKVKTILLCHTSGIYLLTLLSSHWVLCDTVTHTHSHHICHTDLYQASICDCVHHDTCKCFMLHVHVLPRWCHSVLCIPAQENLLEAAVMAIKARLDEQDSNIRQSWLLTEWVYAPS